MIDSSMDACGERTIPEPGVEEWSVPKRERLTGQTRAAYAVTSIGVS
jgi:hypothetical protein